MRHRNRTATLYFLHKVTVLPKPNTCDPEKKSTPSYSPILHCFLHICLASPPLFRAKLQTWTHFHYLEPPCYLASIDCSPHYVTWSVSFSYSILFCYRCWHNWSHSPWLSPKLTAERERHVHCADSCLSARPKHEKIRVWKAWHLGEHLFFKATFVISLLCLHFVMWPLSCWCTFYFYWQMCIFGN